MMVRGVYRLLLALHPTAFRERFEREMLWVFDEMTCEEQRSALGDVVVSVAVQWMAEDTVPRVPVPFGPVYPPSLPAARIAQATTLAALLTIGFFKLLTQSVPLPKTPKDFSQQRRAAWALCRVYGGGVVRHPGDPADCAALWQVMN